MRFFDRKIEIERLLTIREQSQKSARFTILTGRRRIGKTSLVMHAYSPENVVYLFVSRKSEKELCSGFKKEIEQKLGIPLLGAPDSFADVFEFLMKVSSERQITVFIDEFQDFYLVNRSVFSDMQRIWDLNKDNSKINLIVGGSINSLMNRIFRDRKEPLFQRETGMIKLKAFTTDVLKEIFREYCPDHTADDLLALYAFTGGVAKYVELLMDNGAFTREKMLQEIIRDGSVFIDEGKMMLIGEFGKEYGTYFSILSAISRGRNTRSQIEDATGREVGGYLSRLEGDYELIAKQQPVFEKSTNKSVRYALRDNFLTFWFRFIFKYNYMLEISGFDRLREIVERDYDTFSGYMLERYFRERGIESGMFTRIGGWWNRKGQCEIDLVEVDEMSESVKVFEIKRNPERIDMRLVEEKIKEFLSVVKELHGYDVKAGALSLQDM